MPMVLVHRVLLSFLSCLPDTQLFNKLRGFVYRPILKKCGKNFQVASGVKIEFCNNIEIGDNVYIGHGCWLSGLRGGIQIADEVMFGPYVTMVSSNHTMVSGSARYGPGIPGEIVIGHGTWVAAQSAIMAGVEVGAGVIVAAGSVVTKNTQDNVVVGGSPARYIKDCAD